MYLNNVFSAEFNSRINECLKIEIRLLNSAENSQTPPYFPPNSTAEFQFLRAHHRYYAKAGYSFTYIALN
jgi:hypothetical protein